MKPRSLHLEQFGPYVDHVVDLEPLLSEGLFLIHGDTGAGKSTLLDAISYALFGRGLGLRDGEEHLRNKNALPDQPTAVTLEFSLGDARYRVRRTMAHERAARRGGATTRQPAEALMESPSGDPGFATVTSPTRVTDAVQRLLKLEHAQFCRIIVLPQGEFRELLLSRAREREALLEQIFGSELYKSIELTLHEMDKRAEAAVHSLGDRTTSLLASVGAADRDALATMHRDAESEAQRESERVAALADALAASLDPLEDARNVHARNHRRRALDAQCATLRAHAETHRALRLKAEAAERAEPCEAPRRERDRLVRAFEIAESAAREARNAHALSLAALDDPAWSDARGASLAAERARWSDARTTLTARAADARRAAEEARLLAEADHAEVAAKQALQEATDAAAALAFERRATAETMARLGPLAAEESGALMRRAEVSRRLEALQQREALDARRVELERSQRDFERRLRAAEARLEIVRAERDELRHRQRATWAALLAEELSPDAPCPVCGSEVHPRRATLDAAAVEQAALVSAEARFDQAERAALEARTRHTLELGELSGVQQQLLDATRQDSATEFELAGAERAARRAVQEAQLARAEVERTARRAAQLDAAITEAERVRSEREQVATAARARGAALRERLGPDAAGLGDGAQGVLHALEEAESNVAKCESEVTAWSEARARLGQRRASAEERERSAREVAGAASAALTRAEAELAETLAAQGFSSDAEAAEAAMDPAARRALWQEVEREARARAAVETEREGLGAIEEEPDIEALERASEATRAAMQAAQVAVGRASERALRFAELLAQVDRGGAERAEKEAELARVRRVADLANGRSGDRVRLSRFVLLDQFDRVVEAASARLDLMSDGRFRLRRRESRTVGREFDLLVDDAYTGAAERSVETLSGGEMFLASLAMALGLSDVVQQNAGGVRIESLFVDEGFGSLDEESLDKAVMVLEQLQANQRLVGVVSHVPELRKRIPSRLEVVRTDAGSITRTGTRHHAR